MADLTPALLIVEFALIVSLGTYAGILGFGGPAGRIEVRSWRILFWSMLIFILGLQ